MKRISTLFLLPLVLALSGCVYFNTFYNAQKAYDQAMRLKEKRLDKNPEDSVLVAPEEKLKLERSIAKSSKVLELFPHKKKYQPKALFLIGESFLALGEYGKAILKYEELARFYPQARERPVADFHHAQCLFLNGQYAHARTELEKIVATSANAGFRREALGYLAQLEVKENNPSAALDLYEKLLKEQARTPEARANVHLEAAKLAFELKQWERARKHAKAPDIAVLPSRLRYRCDLLATACLFQLGRAAEGVAELEAMLKVKFYSVFIPEIDLKLAEGNFLLRRADKAVDLLKQVTRLAPKSAQSAEAFYRLGDYQLRERKDEKQARVFFDSASAAGPFEYAKLATEKSLALGRLAELRKPAGPDTAAASAHYRDFMIAELFLFRLDNLDSALNRLDRIVADPRKDSVHSVRAAYARAFIQEEFKKSKPASDSLYRFVLEKYPNSEYAKQAEQNLGLKPTVKTDEDQAHVLFLAAETLRFALADLAGQVIPAYRKVTADYPGTREAAKAQFVVAMLFEEMAHGETPLPGGVDSAIASYNLVRERYPQTPYFTVADAKLTAAGIKPGAKAPEAPKQPAPGAESKGAAPATPGRGDPRNRPHSGEPASATPAPADTAFQPPDKPKEELEKDYENVDQY